MTGLTADISPVGGRAALSVVIATRNRPDCVRRLTASLAAQTLQPMQILIIDDGSEPPVSLPDLDLGPGGKLLHNDRPAGACQARNRGFRLAECEMVLVLDDDTECPAGDPTLVARACERLAGLPDVGALAFRQIRASGQPFELQCTHVGQRCQIVTPSFFGCLIRRSAWAATGGFFEPLGYYYEEIEFALRLLEAGYRVLYEPDLSVVHFADERGRDHRRIQRLWARNAGLTAMAAYPWWMVLPAVARTLWTFVCLRSDHGRPDWSGLAGIARELVARIAKIWDVRRPVRPQTLWRFYQLRREPKRIL